MAVKSVKFLSFLVMAINLFNQRSLRKTLTNPRTLQTDPTYCPSSRLVKPAFHIFKPFISCPWNKTETSPQANTSESFDWLWEQHAWTRAIWLACRTKHRNKMSSCLFCGPPLRAQFLVAFLLNEQLPLTCTCLYLFKNCLMKQNRANRWKPLYQFTDWLQSQGEYNGNVEFRVAVRRPAWAGYLPKLPQTCPPSFSGLAVRNTTISVHFKHPYKCIYSRAYTPGRQVLLIAHV